MIPTIHKGTWHRTCYQNSVHKNSIACAKHRYETLLNLTSETASSSTKPLLRSGTEPRKNKRKTCFFCDEEASERKNFTK